MKIMGDNSKGDAPPVRPGALVHSIPVDDLGSRHA